uniref:AlNc14C27G2659 protein n=1 Tax=Albugo laibachii Nc14 TaxID=890382 RepID=F0W730_9STRA|nr:AlNc14C27G2659 [Albugo laibachii Nc14]|eukprot:CCA16929.1 AlNc14C27G2659 [Albugo laibachii Nc14]
MSNFAQNVYGGDFCIPAAGVNAQPSHVYERIIIHEWALNYESRNQNYFMIEIFRMSPIEDALSVLLMNEERIVNALFPVESHDTPPIFKRPYTRLNVKGFEESCPEMALTTKKRKKHSQVYCCFW